LGIGLGASAAAMRSVWSVVLIAIPGCRIVAK
jgi:hypothetical protein